MILFINVKITSHRFFDYRQSNHYPNSDRMDVFKYALASYSAMLSMISKCVFYIEIAPEFEHRRTELQEYISSLFPSEKLDINWFRINLQNEWKNVCDKLSGLSDEIIWMAGNDDHIFIDSNLDIIESGIDLIKNDPDPMAFIYYSHWPEQMRMGKYNNAELTADGNFIKYNWSNFDAIMVLKLERMYKYFSEHNFGNHIIYKTDELTFIRPALNGNGYAPTKEIGRHFDGYAHVANLNNIVPPLFIPIGFFEKNIRIKYGYNYIEPGWVNINPEHSEMRAINPNGIDYRWSLEDIPLFWKDRISEIDVNPNADLSKLKEYRNMYYLISARLNMNAFSINFTQDNLPPDEWFTKHILK